ncbi:MAG: hypothetical protein WDA27_00740 [Actinomycetota bacterium]
MMRYRLARTAALAGAAVLACVLIGAFPSIARADCTFDGTPLGGRLCPSPSPSPSPSPTPTHSATPTPSPSPTRAPSPDPAPQPTLTPFAFPTGFPSSWPGFPGASAAQPYQPPPAYPSPYVPGRTTSQGTTRGLAISPGEESPAFPTRSTVLLIVAALGALWLHRGRVRRWMVGI